MSHRKSCIACVRSLHTSIPHCRASITELKARYPPPVGPNPKPEPQPAHMKRRLRGDTPSSHPLMWVYDKTPGSKVPDEGWRIYRLYMQHMRLIPDPHVWRIMVPRMRKLCVGCRGHKSSRESTMRLDDVLEEKTTDTHGRNFEDEEAWKESQLAEMRVRQAHKNAKKELNQIRAAVACHPHAMERFLEEAYGRRGAIRWDLIYAIEDSSTPLDPAKRPNAHLLGPNRPSLPPALQPLAPPPISADGKTPRARTYTPPREGLRKAKAAWNRERSEVKPPLVLPSGSGPKTGWEDLGIVDSLRVLAGTHEDLTVYPKFRMPERLQEDEIPVDERSIIRFHELETFRHLPKRLQAIFPIKIQATRREPRYPVPPPSHVRETPGRWSRPRDLAPRLVRRMYQRLFYGLSWVIPRHRDGRVDGNKEEEGRWVKCTFEQFRMWESGERGNPMGIMNPVDTTKWAVASEKEQRWIREVSEKEGASTT